MSDMTETDYKDRNQLLCSSSAAPDGGIEKEDSSYAAGIKRVIKQQIDRGLSLSGRRLSMKRSDREQARENQHPYVSIFVNGGPHHQQHQENPESSTASAGSDILSESAPPEWALLLIGCLLGLATGLCVAAFNHGVHVIHEWAWAGTPNEGASWLRLQRLADTWHRVLLIPVTGGVMVGMLHGLLEILDQIRQSRRKQRADPLSTAFPVIKAIQAAITLGTGCSLGPEGPSVDIGKSCGNGLSLMMENNRERKIALIAAGAAAGIASGFNAAVAGCFFSIETVLRPLRAENSPPFTTAMIILASVVSSTVSNVLLGERPAFTVPAYELKSAAELPLYLILGMVCGAVSVAFTRMVAWCAKGFEFAKDRAGLPAVICPALGGLGAGVIALRYPGILYWGFTNVDEILHTGKSASAPGIWLLAQLVAAKVTATALCKGSGLVGGLYAPSLMIGAAVGAVFGGVSARLINSAVPANAAIAQPQAYALVGMAATLASVCSVPLTSVLLLFELTKDYRILLPLMGAVGLAIWVPSVTNQSGENHGAYCSVPVGDVQLTVLDRSSIDADFLLEDIKVSRAVTAECLKVSESVNLDDALSRMQGAEQNAALVVDADELLIGILTRSDVRRYVACNPDKGNGTAGSACTREMSYRGQRRGLLTCYVDTSLGTAKELMEARGIKQLPVLSRGAKDRRPTPVAVVYHHSILTCLRREASSKQVVSIQSGEGSESH